jgi:CHASE2 domain-containing sensor protein
MVAIKIQPNYSILNLRLTWNYQRSQFMNKVILKQFILSIGIGTLALLSNLLTPLKTLAAESVKSPFVAVFVDDATEKVMGAFPYDRSLYARAIAALRSAKAKGVVIKFFLDQNKTTAGDDSLAAEIKKIPVLLQARLDPTEPHPNPLPVSFGCDQRVKGDSHAIYGGQSGWIPLEKFSQGCAGVGFVDLASKNDVLNIPLALKYEDNLMPSLDLIALEMAFGAQAQIKPGGKLTLAGHNLPLDASGQVHAKLPTTDTIDSISFADVMKGTFDKTKVAGKIVILGYDAKETPTLPTPQGPIRIHRLFYHCLENLYEQLMAN